MKQLKNPGKHKIKTSFNSSQYAELVKGRKLIASSVAPDALGPDLLTDASLVRQLSLLGLRWLQNGWP